ncbi:hypothetical protein AEST_06920 [Alishewanella aestuarii B11]|uniref:Uncharacterized protein n=1 Tax=Alishewanella aestuarii B11 TaxID=1197174 RepID=J1QLB6_9ALTE|nr:hypothetical protein [Alishewanella aestuarii]EJI86376.1 hypothetical protein AEST_06920 [Alishewanella aestuarii B11]
MSSSVFYQDAAKQQWISLSARKQNGHHIDMLACGKAIAPEHGAAEPTYPLALLPVPKNK